MDKLKIKGLCLDDIAVMPKRTDVSEPDLSTDLTKAIRLNIPLMSFENDSDGAISMSRLGGIGIIKKNLSIEQQCTEVDKVKRSQHGVITDPFYLSPNNYLHEAESIMAKYHISGVPICENKKLVGIITNRDLRFETNYEKKIYEVMTHDNLITAPIGTTLETAKQILMKHKIEKLPIVDERNYLMGLITIKDIEKTIKYPNAATDSRKRLLVGASIVATDDTLERAEQLISAKVDVLVVDNEWCHSTKTLDIIKLIRQTFESIPIIAGNVATKSAARELIEMGVDAIKVGMTTTHINSGVYVPQVTALLECKEIAQKYNVPMISDCPMKFPGDLTKSIAVGANVATVSNYTGTLKDTAKQLLNGLHSGMKYCGAKNIDDLINHAELVVLEPKHF